MNHLRVAFAPYWQSIQHALFPQLERVLGPLTEKQQQLVQTLEDHPYRADDSPALPSAGASAQGPCGDGAGLGGQGGLRHADDARAAGPLGHRRGAAADLRLGAGVRCRASRSSRAPSPSSRTRSCPSASRSADLEHRARSATGGGPPLTRLTAIEAREKPAAKEKAPRRPLGRGRLTPKGEAADRRSSSASTGRRPMSLPAMLDDLPTACDVGPCTRSEGQQGLQVRPGSATSCTSTWHDGCRFRSVAC